MVDGILRNVNVLDQRLDLAWEDGHWVAMGQDLPLKGKTEIEGDELYFLPHVYDPHVHLNDPGRTAWENVTTGSKALARGGISLYTDMPLNSSPVTTSAKALALKKEATAGRSYVDYSFYGGVTPHNLDAMEELAQGGVIGFKAFTCPSGLDEFEGCDAFTLLKAMEKAKTLGLPILVHAEHASLIKGLQKDLHAQGKHDARAFLESRPVLSELLAVEEACALALETGAHLHLCHLSTARSMDICKMYQEQGARISYETNGHYLLWNEEKVVEGGALYKCTPPLRSEEERRNLLKSVMKGQVSLLASDHSPAPQEMKSSPSFFEIWGGIASLQHHLPILCSLLLEEGLTWKQISAMVSSGPLHTFGLSKKRGLALGKEASFTLLRKKKRKILKEELLYQVKESAFVGEELLYDVEACYLRGEAIYQQGHFSEPRGRFVHAGSID